jgi:hypothetical protein
VASPEYARPMAPYYANAKQIERGVCWRMVSMGDGYRKGSPTGCPEPVRWTGNTMIGRKRYRLDSCEGHADELENLRPIQARAPASSSNTPSS